MRLIEELSDLISEEIDDAERYAKRALDHRDAQPGVAKLFNTLAMQELDHAESLHGVVVDVIAEYKRDHGEPPADMMAVYNYLHKRQTAHLADVKAMIAAYR